MKLFRLLPIVAVLLGACAPVVTKPVVQSNESNELANALTTAAQRAVDIRVRLASMQPAQAEPASSSASIPVPPSALITPAARIDVDYVGPAENATKLISRILGWQLTTLGKKRSDVIVSLRHSAQDPITILRDIGAQCGNRCDVHVNLIEAGKSSISLTYRE